MPETAVSSNEKSSILVSRNHPLVFLVGAAGFLGSHIADELLKHNIQVIGVDDFSFGKKLNLENAIKDKDFHLITQSINHSLDIKLPRLDYAVFVAESDDYKLLLSDGIKNFLEFIKRHQNLDLPKTKVVLVSSINLYHQDLEGKNLKLKKAESYFANFVKENNLNARVVRLGAIFGPRMHFREQDSVIRLLQATLLEELQQESISLDFSSRALFVTDAVRLILKTLFSGSTAQKIYDGVLEQPIKVSEIKQILLDPLWHEARGFKPTELPPWPTPNLKRTIRELSWKPHSNIVQALKETIVYFKEKDIEVPKPQIKRSEEKNLNWASNNLEKFKEEKKEERPPNKEGFKFYKQGIGKKIAIFIGLAIVLYGLILPIVSLTLGAFSIRQHLSYSKQAVERGDFEKAVEETKKAKSSIDMMQEVLSSLEIVQRLGILNSEISELNKLLMITEEGIDGIEHANEGMKSLIYVSKIISGEKNEDPRPYYNSAQTELAAAAEKIAKVKVNLSDDSLLVRSPAVIRFRIEDLSKKLDEYFEIIEKAKTASYLLPHISAIDGQKSYLVLLQNNLELRPAGGFIGSFAQIDFEKGRIKNIKVDDIYNLDGALKDVIAPPIEIRQDLGQERWFLRDSNFEPDFPSSARQAEFFYTKEAGVKVHGVFSLDLTASAKLVKALGGLDLQDYNVKITEENLFEEAVTHAEVGFFPGSQAKKNFLTSLQTQLFNQLFFISNQNWPEIVSALGESLEEKHLQLYLADPEILSYIASQNWAGILPRQADEKQGETNDFLAVVESNMGANKVNYFLERRLRLETKIDKDGEVTHHLAINYKNNSPSDTFPAGSYKNRFRIYLPAGASLNKASYGEADITSEARAFSDYGRSGYSLLLELAPKEQKILLVDYKLQKPLNFKESKNEYRLDVIKQAGTFKDKFDWQLNFPIDIKVNEGSSQELNFSTDLSKDRSFLVNFTRN